MYRLLIVTNDQAAKDMFASMEGWEALGFKPPRLRERVEDTVACMEKHHIDAIAIADDPAFAPLMTVLDERYPQTLLFSIEDDAETQLRTVREVYSLLTRIHADDSNDEYDDLYRLQKQRERWLRKVVSGLVPDMAQLRRQLRMYRCREQLDVPCMLARLELPDDDAFLSDRWHYGSDRLETALRNFFGREHDHMLVHVAVVSPQEVRVLCYPQDADEGLSENAAFEYVQETVEQIGNYLGLGMKVTEVCRIPGLQAFASENEANV